MYVNERNSMSAAQSTTVHPGLPGPCSASEITTLWRYTNLFIIIIIIIIRLLTFLVGKLNG